MNRTTYDVRVWKTDVYRGKRVTTYRVRWEVAGHAWKESFRNQAQADSFRSELLTAARKGEAFDIESGRPLSMSRADRSMSWYDFACEYVDIKWPRVAATTRRTHAEALTPVTVHMWSDTRGMPDERVLRSALAGWAFNTPRRAGELPPAVAEALRWARRHTRPVAALADPEVLRGVLAGLSTRLDGRPYAPSVASRRRKILNAAVEYAVERKLLDANPIPALKWTPPRAVQAVDKRRVANPVQARTLLRAVEDQPRSGPRLVAFFGCLYFAGMRPEEAVSLRLRHLELPEAGWGRIHLDGAEPYAGKEWTDSGENRDRRQLKQRERGEIRTVPSPPELTDLLRRHIALFGTGPDGRLFIGERNGAELPKLTIVRAWRRARESVFTAEVVASPLVQVPYDLRHAAVSTWLNGGVPATDVAEWAGHSVEILHRIYAKCLDGGEAVLRARVEAALGHRGAT
jgi:integrase